ncbi:MAG: hypothetical protein Fur0046_09230 [Cyanobacteria bacterium J069]
MSQQIIAGRMNRVIHSSVPESKTVENGQIEFFLNLPLPKDRGNPLGFRTLGYVMLGKQLGQAYAG